MTGSTASPSPGSRRQGPRNIGGTGGEYGVRGYLKSFNAKTGATNGRPLRSRRRASRRDPAQGRQLESRRADLAHRKHDAETNTLYWGVGNPGSRRDPSGRQSLDESMLAFDPDSGKMKWGYQYAERSVDYDGMATLILFDTR
jgi:alcohol dehydrogenase (cytochrome c)